jgi:acylphosphatase
MDRADWSIQRFVVTGRVQGVGFRIFLAREATRLRISGWVRNRGVNQVEAVVAGDPGALVVLATLAARGPSGARVDDFHSEASDPAALAKVEGASERIVVAPSI